MRNFLTISALVLGASAGLSGQQDSTRRNLQDPQDSTDVLVLDHDFTGPGEFARVFLQKGLVYKAIISEPSASLEIYPIKGGSNVFTAREESDQPGASGFTVLSVYPRADAEYQVRLLEGGPVVNLKIYRDVRASRRRQKVINEPGWEIGGEIAGGFHSGYKLHTASVLGEDNDDLGGHIEGCFSARSGPGILQYVSGCALGIGWDSRPGSVGVVWFFMEPRVRFLGGKERGKSNTEVGAVLRVGFGQVSKVSQTPTLIAPGLYASRNIRRDLKGNGWSFTLRWNHYLVGNRGRDTHKVGAEMISLGLGYY